MMRSATLISLSSFFALVCGQQAGTLIPEQHPTLTWKKCTAGGSCTTVAGSITLDANLRWLHSTTSATNCYTGNAFDATICPEPVTCTANCALEGANYAAAGITTSGNAIRFRFKSGVSTPSRVYLMASDSAYQTFKPKNQEFTFDVDVSQLGCGLNGALSFNQMDSDGGMARFPGNRAGAKYGTGYCDSKCPRDLRFVHGQANVQGWTPSPYSPNAGEGDWGSCCDELDIWEANKISTALTAHPCTTGGSYRCTGATCTSTCDGAGCDFNPYRLGDTTFYGPSRTVDTTRKFTVITQFLTTDGTSNGALREIRRLYYQNGIIQNSNVFTFDSISDNFCAAQKTAFGDPNEFSIDGGLTKLGNAFGRGMVLSMGVTDDLVTNMGWLDSSYPPDAPLTNPGVLRGTCPPGFPVIIEQPDSSVVFSNIKFGDIGSTYPV